MEDYQIMSHNKLKDLEHSMESLSKNLNNMIDMFSSAATSMGVEEKEEKVMQPVMNKLDKLIDQNEKIASGILAVADMVREEIPKIRDAIRRLEHSSMRAPMPSMPSMPRPKMAMPRSMPKPAAPKPSMPPRPSMPSMMPQHERPAMPPGLSAFEKPKPVAASDDKKKGMFSGLFSK